MTGIDLVSFGHTDSPDVDARDWKHGTHQHVPASVAAIAAALESLTSDAALVWDATLPMPSLTLVEELLDGPADAWHAGLLLGTADRPRLYDSIRPLWMPSMPVEPDIETTSWRVSLRALLVRTTVVRQLGGPWPNQETLDGAGLELGLRWLRAGALIRHVPGLLPAPGPESDHGRRELASDLDGVTADDVRLALRHHGKLWAGWALQRSAVTRRVPLRRMLGLLPLLRRPVPANPAAYEAPPRPPGDLRRRVTVVLPTIDRYPYLEELLHQLADQTIPPHQVVIVDQTPAEHRRGDLTDIEPDLPVVVIHQDVPGQSTARNRALAAATGELALFLDDDDEIGPELIAQHLAGLTDGIDVHSGGVDDATAGPIPEGFRHRRASDTFPTNNTVMRIDWLRRSGPFDPAFDTLPQEDHDLGLRLHRAGALLVNDPTAKVFHHHAPAGGLRTHGVRGTTRASARRSLTERNLPQVSSLAMGYRYFGESERREARALTLLTTLSGDGSPLRRALRFIVQTAILPATLRHLRRTDAAAARFPSPPTPTKP